MCVVIQKCYLTENTIYLTVLLFFNFIIFIGKKTLLITVLSLYWNFLNDLKIVWVKYLSQLVC